MKQGKILKPSMLAAAVCASMGIGLASFVADAGAATVTDTTATSATISSSSSPKKFLLVWNGDQVLNDGGYGQPDFFAVIDATPGSATYGHVVNTALMPAVYGAHLLSETENIVDNAVTAFVDPNYPSTRGDALDGGLKIPSSTLNEAHHLNIKPRLDTVNGHKYIYPGGLISSNLFACDVTDPMHIKPVIGTTKSVGNPLDPFNAAAVPPTDNICGLAVSSLELHKTSGTDDVMVLPNGNLIVTMMGYKGKIDQPAGEVLGAHTVVLGPGVSGAVNDPRNFSNSTMPPTLQTPGGLLEFDYQGNVVGEHPAAIPAGAVYPSGPLAGKRIAPDRFRARAYLNETAVLDTGPEAHPHGMGFRADLNSRSPYWGFYHQGGMAASDASVIRNKGIYVSSDYADPVSLAVSQGADKFENLGTTVRFFHMNDMKAGPYAVSQMPDGPRVEDIEMHEEPEGLMAMATTHLAEHKGMFVASMCGGSIFYTPDMTVAQPKFTQVYDFGACTGTSVFFVTQNDKYLVIPKAGIVSPGATTKNGNAYNRDYAGEHAREVVVLDVTNLVMDNHNPRCDSASADKWNNTGVPQAGSGKLTTLGPNPANAPHPETHGIYWPNNGKGDCPVVASRVNLDSPTNDASHGGPHFTVADKNESYVATAEYFVDLRRYPVGGSWAFFGITPFDPFDGKGNNLGFAQDFLPGTGSVGDNNVCMMKFNRWTGALALDASFKDGTGSRDGCISMERASWPHGATGNASPHAMTFVEK